MKKQTSDQGIAPTFIRENFKPEDRLAVVLLNKRTGTVIQRMASAEKIGAPDFQAWLKQKNAERMEVYVSMNAFQESAQGRTKADVAAIRHVFLDFDENGTAALESLLKREDLPKPNYVVATSPGRWQVIWKVEAFTPVHAEQLQRTLARETGADIAATDSARVLRLPGFYNHKYTNRHWVGAEKLSEEVYRADRFPTFPADDRGPRSLSTQPSRKARTPETASQSEKDWAFAKRALSRGDPPETVIAAILLYRRHDKPNPNYYAELTVRKAADSLAAERPPTVARGEGPDR